MDELTADITNTPLGCGYRTVGRRDFRRLAHLRGHRPGAQLPAARDPDVADHVGDCWRVAGGMIVFCEHPLMAGDRQISARTKPC